MRKRSRYRPKPVITDPLVLLRPADQSKRLRLLTRMHTALESIRAGRHPGPEEWRDLSDVVNIVEVAADRGNLVHDEVMPSVRTAIDAMCEAQDRYKRGLAMRLSGAGVEAMAVLLGVYHTLLIGLTGWEMERLIAETNAEVRRLQRELHHRHTVVAL